ncbi:MAG: TetR/AcrR family transcriptional regulator [Capsulimonadales bacterium]|nr:TetR/AcrR family transcriptional regulator [Capsulimonadales bacterium]
MAETNPCTRQLILESAQRLFLHYGYKKTTIDDIAQEAGIGKGTVYLYFDGKEEILLTIAAEVKRSITARMRAIADSSATPEEKLRRMVLASITAVHDAVNTTAHGVELVDELLRPKIMQCGLEQKEAQYDLLAQVLAEGVKRGDFTVLNDDTTVAARLLMLAMISFYPPYMTPCHGKAPCRGELEARAELMMDFILHGIRPRPQ